MLLASLLTVPKVLNSALPYYGKDSNAPRVVLRSLAMVKPDLHQAIRARFPEKMEIAGNH